MLVVDYCGLTTSPRCNRVHVVRDWIIFRCIGIGYCSKKLVVDWSHADLFSKLTVERLRKTLAFLDVSPGETPQVRICFAPRASLG